MYDRIEWLRIVPKFGAQRAIEPVGQVLYCDFVGQRLVTARADLVALPRWVAAPQLFTPGAKRGSAVGGAVYQDKRQGHALPRLRRVRAGAQVQTDDSHPRPSGRGACRSA